MNTIFKYSTFKGKRLPYFSNLKAIIILLFFIAELVLFLICILPTDLAAQEPKRGVKITPKTSTSISELYDKSYAVVIGINRYEKWPNLEYAVNDVRALEKSLKEMGFQTFPLIDHQATRVNILKILGDDLPRRVEKNDRVIVFFAGHGQTEDLPDGSQMGYIIPFDADTRDLYSTAISMEQVRGFSRRLKAKHVLYLMDSCYSGLGLSRSAGTIPPTAKDYLKKITSIRSHQMITAGGKGEQVREEGGHGIFTRYLLEAIAGAADRDAKGYVTFTDIAAYIKPKVTLYSKNAQTPQYGNIDGDGEFVFAVRGIDKSSETSGRSELEEERRKLVEDKKMLEEERARVAALRQQIEERRKFEEERIKIEAERKKLEEDKKKREEEQEKRTPASESLPLEIRGHDGAPMVLVPAGQFMMGSDTDEIDRFLRGFSGLERKRFENEVPKHLVYLDTYYIDKYEVTNALYLKFVQATGYVTNVEKQGYSWTWNFREWKFEKLTGANWRLPDGQVINIRDYLQHPVVQIDWDDAVAYCQWAGKRLPTEAEWEKAARGIDGMVYPWGNDWDRRKLNNALYWANKDLNVMEWKSWWQAQNLRGKVFTKPVGSYESGKSPYGAYDMAGNVWEGVADWYDEKYYRKSPTRNPKGPESGQFRLVRGGSWFNGSTNTRTTFRNSGGPVGSADMAGFRCAKAP